MNYVTSNTVASGDVSFACFCGSSLVDVPAAPEPWHGTLAEEGVARTGQLRARQWGRVEEDRTQDMKKQLESHPEVARGIQTFSSGPLSSI